MRGAGPALLALACLTSAAAAQRPPTRLPDGRPGAGYWQQRVSYAVDATLHPERRLLEGRARITYYNNSPDTLRALHWHLYQNLFRPGASGRGAIVGREVATTRGIAVRAVVARGDTLRAEVDGTLMRTPLAAPLAPGRSLALDVAWDYEIPPTPSVRTGSRGREMGITLWYPQVAVYDDVRGWDATRHTGQAEFYLEYGDWDVRLTMPAGYLAAATGELVNPDAVLSAEERRRLALAQRGRVVAVVTPDEARARGRRAGVRTWHWRARQVRDFAVAASPDFAWDATRTHPDGMHPQGVAIHAVYDRRQRDAYAASARRARQAVEHFAARFGPYVYPQATVVSGPVEGMEFPMLAFMGVGGLEGWLLNMPDQVLAHELGHQWFPMMVGSNETRHPFMDEGFATYLTAHVMDSLYRGGSVWNPRLPSGVRGLLGRGNEWRFNQGLYLLDAGGDDDVPLLTHGNAISDLQLLAAGYAKPAAVLVMLRDVIGADAFDRALREYHRRWLLRHPSPADFFATVEDVAGRDLDWFWRQWIETTATLDQRVDVADASRAPAGAVELRLQSRGEARMPATLRLTLADGTRRDVRVSEGDWGGASGRALRVGGLPAPLRSVEIDPLRVLADVDRANNVWPRGTPSEAGAFFGVRFGWLLLATVGGWLVARLARAAGYVLAARAGGGRVVRLVARRRVLWARSGGAGHRDRAPRFAAGTLALPAPLADAADAARALRLRTALATAGGALGSLAAAAALGGLLWVLDGLWRAGHREGSPLRLDAALLVALAVSALALLLGLLPAPSRALLAGRPWLRLLLRPAWGARWSAARALAAASFAGVPPAAWDPRLLRLALDDGGRPCRRLEAAAGLLAHWHARDLGDEAAAAAHLARVEAAAAGSWRPWRAAARELARRSASWPVPGGGGAVARRLGAGIAALHARLEREAAARATTDAPAPAN